MKWIKLNCKHVILMDNKTKINDKVKYCHQCKNKIERTVIDDDHLDYTYVFSNDSNK